MKTIVLEMERLRNTNAGLGQYCLHLGRTLASTPADRDVYFECYLPQHLSGILGPNMGYRPVRKWHKLTGISTDAALWHCTHQDTAYFPTGNRTALVMTIHDLNFLERDDFPQWRKHIRLRQLQKKINRCSGLVYISGFVRDAVHEHLQLPASIRERVIYNGVAVQQEQSNRKVESGEYLFSIGLHPKKNYAVALPILLANPQYRWVIAGEDNPAYRASLLKAAEKSGVARRLEFRGVVSEAEKWNLYRNCTALLFPSLSEGFGLPVLEAMSFGKPVFLSNRTSLPEIGGREAYYFDRFDAGRVQEVFAEGMKNFQEDAGKPERLKRHAAAFNWETAAREYRSFYRELIQD